MADTNWKAVAKKRVKALTPTGRYAIIKNGRYWFVRSVRIVEHDMDRDEKVYRCNCHISGPHKTLSSVPQVAKLLKRRRP